MIKIDPQLVKDIIYNGKRIDNRRLDEYRKITVEKNAIATAEGSARVRIGNTEVVAGVKFTVGEPFSDTPDEGVLMIATELVPLASPEFESGPPGEDAIEISRVVDRAIRESKTVDFKKLCIKPGEKTWIINVDIDVLDDDGNLIDASSLAATAALLTAKIPQLDEKGDINYEKERTEPLPMNGIPLSVTMAKISDRIIVDPDLSEMEALDARLTVGTFDKDGEIMLCSMQKGGSTGFTLEELDHIIDIAVQKSRELRELVK
jgi:exosome complex component RRP42